jgi:hypothetical protein
VAKSCQPTKNYFIFAFDFDLAPDATPPRPADAVPVRVSVSRSDFVGGYQFRPESSRQSVDAVLVAAPTGRVEDVANRLVGRYPAARIDMAGMASAGGDAELDNLLDVFRWGGSYAIVCSLLGAAVSVGGLLSDRRSGNAMLHVLGASRRTVGNTVLVEVSVGGGLAVAAAWMSGVLWTMSLTGPSDQRVPLLPTAATALLAWVALSLVAVCVNHQSSRMLRADAVPTAAELDALDDVVL